MAFQVGQKVVCFKGSEGNSISRSKALAMGYTHPELGEVVTIKTLNVWPHMTILTFQEHDNSHIQRLLDSAYEPGFDAACFRPLAEKKTDISFAFEILRKATKKDGAHV
jgi:hypothetical protein